jgi:hypothetical protein
MHLKDVNENLEHRIIGGSEYGWKCYGDNARYLDYESEYAHCSCIFDTMTQEIYEVTVDMKDSEHRPYRWLNPVTKHVMYEEAAYREIDVDKAWDEVTWIDLETEQDFLEKASAIFKGQPFDTRVSVPLDLNDEELFVMMKLAHERDITLNQLMVEVLQAAIDNNKQGCHE